MSDRGGMVRHGQFMESKMVGFIRVHNVVLNLLSTRVLDGLLLLGSRVGCLLRLGTTGESLVGAIHLGRRRGYSCTGIVLVASGVVCGYSWTIGT